jgi:hypothetical protein
LALATRCGRAIRSAAKTSPPIDTPVCSMLRLSDPDSNSIILRKRKKG